MPIEHDRALEGIGVHDRNQSPENHVDRGDQGKEDQGGGVIDPERGFDEPCTADKDCRGVERHGYDDDEAGNVPA